MLPPRNTPTPNGFADAIFYEIYPLKSFVDSNGDGYRRLFPGITLKLTTSRISDATRSGSIPVSTAIQRRRLRRARRYKKVASLRHQRRSHCVVRRRPTGAMHVILDLVPGHTSEEHEWFHRSYKVGETVFRPLHLDNSWISGGDGLPFIGGESPRNGTPQDLELLQMPAGAQLRFRAPPERSWQKPALGPDAKATWCDGGRHAVLAFPVAQTASAWIWPTASSKRTMRAKPLYHPGTWQYMFARSARPSRSRVRFRPEE